MINAYKKLPKITIQFKYKTFRGTKVFWDFSNDIPPLKVVAGPTSPDWPKRVEEEIKVFEIWRKFNKKIPLKNLQPTKNNRRFIVEVNTKSLFDYPMGWIKVHILIPLRYPNQMPHLGDPSLDRRFLDLLNYWTNGRPFCMPKVINLWWYRFNGRAGIAHFLHAFMAFLSIAGRKSKKLNIGYYLDI